MKYKHRIQRLEARRRQWELLSSAEKSANKKPGSLNK